MKKWLSLFLAALMLLSLTACGGAEKESGGASGAPKTPGEAAPSDSAQNLHEVTEPVEIDFWHNYSNEKRAQWIDSVAAEFNASQDMVTVKPVYIGGYPAIAEQVAGALAAHSGVPAITTINAPRVLNYASSGIIEPLDSYMAGLEDNDYFPEMLNGLRDSAGDLYAIPFGISGGCCIYNKTLLDSLGLPFPETWEDFKDWCKDVYEATGKTAFAFAYDFNYMNTFFLNVTGIAPLGDGTESVLDDERIVSFVQDLRELCQAGYCSYMGTSINNAKDDQMAAFSLGEIAAYTDTSTSVGDIISKMDFEVGTAIGVSGTDAEPVTTVSGACLVIYEENDQNTKNAAFQWATYLTNAENSSAWTISTCMFPARESCEISAMYEEYPGAEGIFDHADRIVGKNKSPVMQAAMEVVASAVGEYVKGDVAEADFEAMWENTKKEVDILLADA